MILLVDKKYYPNQMYVFMGKKLEAMIFRSSHIKRDDFFVELSSDQVKQIWWQTIDPTQRTKDIYMVLQFDLL